ncbi:MAG TPA: hypothetical protein VGB13_08700 [Candidatus Krumholzibacteria bacterium]
MRSCVALLILGSLTIQASATTLRGTLRNMTTGEVGRASSVRLVDAAGGMNQIGTLIDVEGDFVLTDLPQRPGAPYLIQTQHDGVLYSQSVMLNAEEVDVVVEIYDASDDMSLLRLSMHHLVFERHEAKLAVMEFMEFDNASDPPVSVWRDQGPIIVQLPQGAMEPFEVSVSLASGMPLKQELLETDDETVYTVASALKPGKTRVVIRYALPYDGSPYDFKSRLSYPVGHQSVMLSPYDILLTSAKLKKSDGASPMPGYGVYIGEPSEAGLELAFQLSGGSTHAVDPEADPHAGLDQGGHGPNDGHNHDTIESIAVRPHRFATARARVLLMGGLGALLLLGMFLARGAPKAPKANPLDELEEALMRGELDPTKFAERAEKLQARSRG